MTGKSDGTVYINTLVDTNGFNRGMNAVEKRISALGNSIKKLGVTIASAFAISKLVQYGKQFIELGSDLQEVENVVDTVFTTMSDKVDEFAKGAAEAAGLSETMAKRYVGTFGAMAKAFGFAENEAFTMSTALTQLAGDVASFYNITQDEAYTKLKSVFTGETESLKDLGVVMTQSALDSFAMAEGLGKTTKQMTEQEKVALRYRFVLNQLSDASGDFQRTSDGWANQMRILKLNVESIMATLGQALINFFTPVIKVINTVLSKVATLANAFKAFSEMITGKKSESKGSVIKETASELQDLSAGYGASAEAAEDLTGATKEATKANKKYLSGLDEIRTFQSEKDEEIGSLGSGSLNSGLIAGAPVDFGVIEGGNEALEETTDLLKKFEERFPKLFGFLKEFGRLIKEIFHDFKIGDFFEAGKDVSDLVTLVFDFISDVIDSIDWKAIGKKIGDFLAGIKWLDIIKSALRLRFNIWKAIAEVWFGSFSAAPLETAILTALAALKFTPLGGLLGKAIKKAVLGGSLVTAITGAFASLGGIGGILTMDLATIIGAGTIAEIGLAIGTALIGGIVSAFAGFEIGKAIGKYINPQDAKWYDNFHWFGDDGFFDTITDNFKNTLDAIVLMMTDFENNPIVAGLANALAGPIVALGVHISANKDVIKNWFENDIKPWFTAEKWNELWNNVKNAFSESWNAIVTWWNESAVSKWIEENVKPFLTKEKWLELLANIKNAFTEKFTEIFAEVKNKISEELQNAKQIITEKISEIKTDWDTKWEEFSEKITGVWDGIKSTISSAVDKIKEWINEILGLFDDTEKKASKISGRSWSSGISSIVIPSIPSYGGYKVNVPQLATGAVIPPNAPFMAVLGDQRRGTNIEAPEDLIRKIVREESGGKNVSGNVHMTIVADGNPLFDFIIEKARLLQMSTSENVFVTL